MLLGLALHHVNAHKKLESACQNGDQDQANDGPAKAKAAENSAGCGGEIQTQEVIVQVDPSVKAGNSFRIVLCDGLDQVDLAVGHQLSDAVLHHGGAVLHLDDGAHVHAHAGDFFHKLLNNVIGEHHQMGDGLAHNGIKGQQNRQRQEAPEAAAHGVDTLFCIELLHLLLHLHLIVGVLLLDLLDFAIHPVHAHHALLGFHLEGQHNELQHHGKEDDGHAVRAGQCVKQADQPGKRDTNNVSEA